MIDKINMFLSVLSMILFFNFILRPQHLFWSRQALPNAGL
jgi:hypothetical protein